MGDSVSTSKWVSKSNAVIGILALAVLFLGFELHRSNQSCEEQSKENSRLYQLTSEKAAPLLICARDIPAGTIISKDMLDTEIVPINSYPTHVFDNIYSAIGREMLLSQKRGEPICPKSLGFAFRECGMPSIEESKKFNLFKGLATANPPAFTLADHKINITDARLEHASKGHILVKDADYYVVSFNLTIDGRRPRTKGTPSVYFTHFGDQTGFEEFCDYGDSDSIGFAVFHLKCPAKSLTTTVPIRIYLSDTHSIDKKHPSEPAQVVTFTLPKL